MATVEPCEAKSSGLSSISNTLNLYDTFKPSQEDEKESDEESFHLPMLDCDDDELESTKEVSTKGMGKEISADETEDDILNKFETNGTPDIDPKMEDHLLNEIDNILDKKLDENSFNIPQSKDVSSTNNKESVVEKSNNPVDGCVSNEMEVTENKESSTEDTETDTSEVQEKLTHSVEMLNKDGNSFEAKQQETKVDEKEEPVCKTAEKQQKNQFETEAKNDEDTVEGLENKEEKTGSEGDKAIKDKIDEIIPLTEVPSEETSEKTEFDTNVQEQSASDSLIGLKSQEENDLIESNDNSIEIVKIDSALMNQTSKTGNDDTLQTQKSVESMDVDNEEEKDITNDDVTITKEVSSKEEDSNQCTTEILDNIDKTSNDNESEMIKKTVAINNKDDGTDNCENSNDCEDLLDISIIRDADEDNASAIAEDANDAHPSEKSDNDNDDQEEGSDKAENETELDESEMDQEDTLLCNDKDDNMDFEDGSSNLCDQDTTISGSISDSESKNNVEVTDTENDSKDVSAVLKSTSDVTDVELNIEKDKIEQENVELKDGPDNTAAEGNKVSDNIKEPIQASGKRSLSETDDTESPSKRIKLSEHSEEKMLNRKNTKTKTLQSFEKFMQSKKLENKLTRSDLEQFCLQKICEAIMHKTDVGELHQTIKKQEQIIENLRKDLQQLTKQTRDLDIVNKKLMNELRAQNGTKKPLVPLKITRSVGLQVKLTPAVETNNRRKVPIATTPRTPTSNSTPAPARPRIITPAASSVVRQVAASPRKTSPAAPLLSQALQTRQVTAASTVNKRPQIRPKPTESQKPANSSVIDLTDEDDKASKSAVVNPVKILNKTISPLSTGKPINIIPVKTNHGKTVAVGQVKAGVGNKVGTPTRSLTTLPQGVRLTQTQVKNGSIAIPANVVTSNAGTTQFMYVVQPGPVVTTTAGGTQKAVLLNFQPTNGVLTSTLNGSAVSVLPSKTANTVQLKTVATIRKHPAPLPSPPPITANASLKPLLPKPHLSIRKTDTGIILQWRMPYNLDIYEAIASYQLFAYQETNAPPSTDMWRKVGDVKALALPMACTLTQFADKNKYYFAVRSIDVHKRIGAFSDPEEISL